jgi:hypothetical protein
MAAHWLPELRGAAIKIDDPSFAPNSLGERETSVAGGMGRCDMRTREINKTLA